MAAPITHVVLTEKIWSQYFAQHDKSEFILGTSFPDIRYLGSASREQTHQSCQSLSELTRLPSFQAGLKFHTLVDRVREKFVVSHNIYSYLPDSAFVTQAVKIFEDGLLHNKLANWSDIITIFDHVSPEELKFGIPETDVIRWHQLLQAYFWETDTRKRIQLFVEAIGKPATVADEIISLVEHLQTVEETTVIATNLYEKFEALFKKS